MGDEKNKNQPFLSLSAANLAAPLSRTALTSSGILQTLKSLSTVAQVTSEI